MFKKILIGLVVILPLVAFAAKPIVTQDLEIVPVVKQLSIPELIQVYSIQYNVSPTDMTKVIRCENSELDTNLQSYIKYKEGNRWNLPAGSREQSFGLVMIHLPDHPEISKEQATNPDFAIEYLASNLSKGKGSMWSCYKKIK